MAHSTQHTLSVQRMTVLQLKAVIASGSLLSAAAKAELQRRTK